ncbi:M23 family metallopeptidase [Leucobacter sp. cx-328]|nr:MULTISPECIES: M23 family metallopeptidase [unclassified Leucobacter]MBC9944462.1 M23 family metallopeptidase [Leucobacter sp. cx-328]
MNRFVSCVYSLVLTLFLVSPAVPVAVAAPSVPSTSSIPAPPADATAAASPGKWLPPVGTALQVSGRYRAPPNRYASGHRGIDLPALPGAAVLAPTAGEVTFAGVVADRPLVTIRVDAQTLVSLEPVRSEFVIGDFVSRGAVLGEMASGGHCYAECVHVGVRIDGAYVNPMRFFLARPILLPLSG